MVTKRLPVSLFLTLFFSSHEVPSFRYPDFLLLFFYPTGLSVSTPSVPYLSLPPHFSSSFSAVFHSLFSFYVPTEICSSHPVYPSQIARRDSYENSEKYNKHFENNRDSSNTSLAQMFPSTLSNSFPSSSTHFSIASSHISIFGIRLPPFFFPP